MPLMIACTFATPLPVGERVLEPDPIQSTRRAEVPDVAEADAVSGAAAFGDLTLGRREPGRCLLRRHGRCAGQLHAHRLLTRRDRVLTPFQARSTKHGDGGRMPSSRSGLGGGAGWAGAAL